MRRLLPRLLAIGADPADGPELRLRKALVLTAVLLVSPAAVVWGAIYWVVGAPVSALVPWTFTVIAGITVPVFARTRRYDTFAAVHSVTFLVLPMLLMWSLGGFIGGSIVAIWAWLSPLVAHILGHRRASIALFVAFSVGIVLSPPMSARLDAGAQLGDTAIVAFFVLNIVVVGAISWVLVDASAGGRESSLTAMRALVSRYFSADVAETIVADPAAQSLGGELADVTILFADLGGYTSFSSERSPHEVVEVLNGAFAVALPAITAEGGTPVQLPGDAVMAIFGAPRHVPDHPQRAARAALAIQAHMATLARQHPEWPGFRIGINAGDALVGNIGSDELRNFTAIGDTVNMAQRFGSLARPGQVVTGVSTAERLGDAVSMEWLDEVSVKGKAGPIRPILLHPPLG
jgi:class 3 adenylate cyclase